MATVQQPTRRPSQLAPVPDGRARRDWTRVWQLVTFLVAIAVWAGVCRAGFVSADALPTPLSVLRAFADTVGTAGFWEAVGETLRGAIVGLLLATLVGVPLGLVTGTYAAAERSSRLLVDVLRSFPVIALLPVFLLVLGSKPSMKITVVFIACVFPIFLQAQYGARGVDPTVSETVRSYRIPRLLRFRKVVLPSATPSVMTGLRLAATTSVLVALGVEILTTLPGMGHMVVQGQQNGNAPTAFAYIFTAGLIGFAINKGSELVERRLLRWRPPAVAA
ncbi:MAG: transporter component [Nocardioidaceae bacterium]|nr:transporter component [Nocardioidaceae bacterium]